MSDVDTTVVTAHGRLDRAALTRAQSSYDTTALLSAVEELDRIVVRARGSDGLRDILLRLHGMAHAVINDAGLSVSTSQESLPELAFDATAEILQTISTLQGWVKLIEPLEGLQPRD
ncbi:Tn3 family transposase post-transcriptional regulator TnpC [Delftia tsuruhatensis]|uniref:Tn3 family transposase post-transcriptional regulator TnpC n=1 Tax=Delftia tsuruhatensis TaxID=180282 RepID=UPI0023DBCB4B|nr:Tn3 family transposase post-transcriptional regulator TnpC [Delftia tsuruhatensis]WEL98993.1 Tn3 family transposase post-transcriptional regulator TnpC [Delftia tsuruhatensis]